MSETITAPAPVVAPVEAAPVVAPVVAAPASAAESTPAPTVEAPAPAEAAPAPTSILGDALAPVAPVEQPAPDAALIVEGQSDTPAPPPTYEPFTVPEGQTLQPERIGEFTNLLSEFETNTKADHAAVQVFGQQLIDRHVAEVQRAVMDVHKANMTAWDAQKTAWKDQFIADPELGGNRMQTTVDAAIGFIRTHGGTEAQQAEFQSLMNESGLGNHPVMIRLLAKAGAAMSEGRPLAATTPAAAPKSKTQKLYGGGS
jgi:hypothetical protein